MIFLNNTLLNLGKNLLAFSGGVDSSALFHILLENKIEFDIAIVDYGVREHSKKEVEYAQTLCFTHNKKCFVYNSKPINSNFEAIARKVRYDFFDTLAKDHGYDCLLTAHQLNDWLEWALMRLTNGAGVAELAGMRIVEKKKNYTVVRPLLQTSRDEIQKYLDKNNILYFQDSSNSDEKYLRNSFRHRFTNALMNEFQNGIAKSFEILQKQRDEVFDTQIVQEKELFVAKRRGGVLDEHTISSMLKMSGYVTSRFQREEISKNGGVVGGLFAVELTKEFIFVSPYRKCVMGKKFKELCRKNGIPAKIRGYLFETAKEIDEFYKVVKALDFK